MREHGGGALGGLGRDHLLIAVAHAPEAAQRQQPVACRVGERLGLPLVMGLGRVDALEAQLHGAVPRRADAACAPEVAEQRRRVGNEADRVAVGLLADHDEAATQAQLGRSLHPRNLPHPAGRM